jgi:hypothetical protein
MDTDSTSLGRRALAGGGLLLVGLLFWSLRDRVPAWAAKSVIATAELTTTAERDDAHVQRLFAAVRQSRSVEAGLDSLPNQSRVRHTRLWVRASSSDQAIAQVTAIAQAIVKEFEKEGPGQIYKSVRGRTTPVPDDTTVLVGRALRACATALALLGIALVVISWRGIQAGPDRMPNIFWVGVAVSIGVPLAVVFLPGVVVLTLMIMLVPTAISVKIVSKMSQVHKAAHWPLTSARITKSEPRPRHRHHMDSATTVANVPVVEYDFTLGPQQYHGTHIGIGDEVGNNPEVQRTLDRYPVGATVPVYYNPADPNEAVLERDPPASPVMMYGVAGGIFMAGLAAVAVFANVDTIMQQVRPLLPANSEPQFTIFFGLCGMWTLFMLWTAQRQAAQAKAWPIATGRIVSSRTESYRKLVGSPARHVTFYQAVVEYSYQANGRDYHSTRLSFGAEQSGSQELAEAKAARYTKGSDVTVHYDPKNPSNAVLEVKVALNWLLALITLAFLGLALQFSGVHLWPSPKS